MQNYNKAIGALIAASALVAGNASAEVEYEIHTGYTSEYIFRGTDLGNDLVEVGVDVSTEMWGLGLSAGAWYASFNDVADLNGGVGPARPLDTDFTELDLYAEVSKDLGFMTAAVGYIYYHNSKSSIRGLFPASAGGVDAQEVYFSIGKEFFGIETSLTYFWDVETDNNGYTELYVGKGFELNECLTLNVGGTLGYLWEDSDFAHFTAKVSLDWAFTETATLSPFVAASWELENGYNKAIDGTSGGDDELIGGTMLSVSF